jgi:hypothetical protein
MEQITENIALLLKENEKYRNDDRLLIMEYWRRFDRTNLALKAIKALDDFVVRNPMVTNPATIIRMRQQLQSDGFFLPTDPEVTVKRHKQKVKVREWLGYCITGE